MYNTYPENDWRNYLEHHGILGMKWGVQNGPPYPLGASDHSASEKKAGWRDGLRRATTDAFRSNKLLKESGLYQTKYSRRENKNLWLYDDRTGTDRYRVFVEHRIGKDSYDDVEKKIQTAKRAAKSYETIQKNINKHCKQALEDTYGKESIKDLVEPHAFESPLSGVQEMTVVEPNILNIWAEYARTSNPRDTRTLDFFDIKYDLKKHKALNRGASVF